MFVEILSEVELLECHRDWGIMFAWILLKTSVMTQIVNNFPQISMIEKKINDYVCGIV